jgi:hypothetical protein
MNQDQIQELMDRIQELSEQGRRAEAEALLEMLRQMLENMEMMLAEGGEGQGGQGQQMMQDLAETLRGQQDLADESFQQLQREFRQQSDRPAGDGESADGEGPRPTLPAGRSRCARRSRRSAASCPGRVERPARVPARPCATRSARWARHATVSRRATRPARSTGRPTRSTACAKACAASATRCSSRPATARGEGADAFSDGSDPLGRPLGSRGSVHPARR